MRGQIEGLTRGRTGDEPSSYLPPPRGQIEGQTRGQIGDQPGLSPPFTPSGVKGGRQVQGTNYGGDESKWNRRGETGGEIKGTNSPYTLRPNGYVLWPNANKTNDRQPDFVGRLSIEGQFFRLAAWSKQSAQGEYFLSGQVTAEQE